MNRQVIAIYNSQRLRLLAFVEKAKDRRLSCTDRGCSSVEECETFFRSEYVKYDLILAKMQELEDDFQEVVLRWKEVKWWHRLCPTKKNRALRKEAFSFFCKWRVSEPGW